MSNRVKIVAWHREYGLFYNETAIRMFRKLYPRYFEKPLKANAPPKSAHFIRPMWKRIMEIGTLGRWTVRVFRQRRGVAFTKSKAGMAAILLGWQIPIKKVKEKLKVKEKVPNNRHLIAYQLQLGNRGQVANPYDRVIAQDPILYNPFDNDGIENHPDAQAVAAPLVPRRR